MKINKLTFISILLMFSGCNNFGNTNETLDEKLKLDFRIRDDFKSKLFYYLRNHGTRHFFLAKNAQVIHSGDTLYIQSVFSGKVEVKINQFNPPEMIELPPNRTDSGSLDYEDILLKSHHFVSLRIYYDKYPYDEKSQFINYHSLVEFKRFEKRESFVLTVKTN